MKYILYHHPCPDGTGAALAAHSTFGSEANYIGVNYGQPMPDIPDGAQVFILDFSYPAKDLLALARRCNRVTVLDHHKTAQADLSPDEFINCGVESKNILFMPDNFMLIGNLRIKFDMTKSGAVLAWEHFRPSQVPMFFKYLQDRDLWTFALPDSREVAAALWLNPLTIDNFILAWNTSHTTLVAQGRIALKVLNRSVDDMCKNVRLGVFDMDDRVINMSDNSPHPVSTSFAEDGPIRKFAPVVNASVFFSEVAFRLLELYPNAPFSAYYFDRADGKRQWGLRSRPGYDCSIIAKSFGGGGHAQASGFTTQ